VISGTSIDITVPYGTDITSLEPVIVHSGASVSPTGPQNFTSPVTYTVTAEDATTKGYTVTVTVLSEPVTQHEGGDRYDTAVRASQKAYPDPSEADAVILAYSQNFPDALAASYLAGALDAPILLSDTSGMDEVTEAEIKRLSPSTVYIVGGTGSISEGVKDTLEAYDFAPAVVRLGGAGREETAYEIAKAAKEMGSAPTTAFVADAANFPDALSAGSLSAGQGVPILLTATGSLDEWTQRFLEENDISDIIIVGGSGSVSETVATQLRALSHNPTVTRWSGSDRYATSADVLTKAIAKWNLTPTIIGLASGEGFPDALVGGAAVGNRGGLLAITDPDTLSAAAEGVISTYKDGISDVEIFGGTGTIRIADKVQGLLA
jgi:putative cell wall-binding protein